MEFLLYFVCIVFLLFAFVVFFGAPYLPTLQPQVRTALDLLDLEPGELMIEVGSGDGRVLLAAAKRGWNVVGYELNPLLVVFSLWRTRKYRDQVKVIWGDALRKEWPNAKGVYVFGIDRIMPKLYKKIAQSAQETVKLASFTFALKNQKPVRTKRGVYLYLVEPDL